MSDNQTIFDKIIDGSVPCWKVWEDDNYLAFLTPFPNTPGLTVVIPKKNPGDYVFSMADDDLAGLMAAAKKVARLLEKAFDAKKIGLVFEGEGVPHVHAKLYPMHGVETGEHHGGVHHQEYFPAYPGWISTVEGPRMPDDQLDEIQAKIRKAAEQ
jgi:diadenosine tetraphosphate (Ap4A) HIT family hydrolase